MPITSRDLGTRIKIAPMPVVSPDGQFYGGAILPVPLGLLGKRAQNAYTINGTVLPTQPHLATSPSHSMPVISTGTSFTLLFSQIDGTTASLLASGSKMTMQFLLAHGGIVSGPVILTTSTTSGITHVTVTTTSPITIPTN